MVLDVHSRSIPIVERYKNPADKLVEIEWSNGQTMRVTPGQKFQAIADDYQFEWVEARDLVGRKALAQGSRAAGVMEPEHSIDAVTLEACVLGFVVAEASRLDWRKDAAGRIQINMCEKEPLVRVAAWAKLHDLDYVIRVITPTGNDRLDQNHVRITTRHPALLGVTCEVSAMKTVPTAVLEDSLPLWPFLPGLLDGDGHVRKAGSREVIAVTTYSEKLTHQISSTCGSSK